MLSQKKEHYRFVCYYSIKRTYFSSIQNNFLIVIKFPEHFQCKSVQIKVLGLKTNILVVPKTLIYVRY